MKLAWIVVGPLAVVAVVSWASGGAEPDLESRRESHENLRGTID